ncbi:MAG: hypothetical protein ACT4O3_06260 [Elusimicrobiota bacterium]
MIAPHFHRSFAAGLSFVFLATQVVFAQEPEKSFWDQRRQTARRVQEGTPGGGQETRLARWTPGAALELPPVDKFLAPDRSPVPAAPAEAGLPSSAVSSELPALAALLSRHGVVRDIRPGRKSAPILIYIQDVHGRADAQRSVASILLDIWDRHPDAPLGLEGADGEIDLDPFRGPSVEADREAASFFFNAGFIAGPEFAALAAPGKPNLFGLEDPALYLKNTAAVRAALPRQTAWLEKVAAWKNRADATKAAVFSPALLELDEKTRARENDGLPLGDYLSYLSSRAGGAKKLPNVSLFLQTWAMEKSLDFAAVERERGLLLARLAEGLDRKSLAGLLAASASFRAGELGYADYYRLLKSVAERAGVAWTSFPAFDRYVQYVVRADVLRAEAFFGEISRLEEEAWSGLIATPQQAELHARFKNLSHLEKLVRLSLTSDQWAEYVRRRQAVHEIAGPAAAELAPFEEFYEAAEARNDALAGRMISRLAAPSRTAAPRVAVLVAGGFHAAGLAPLLARHGTLITVSPKFEIGPGGAENDYLSVFTRGKLPLEQLFESPKISLVGRPAVATPSGRNMLARLMPPLRHVFAALKTKRTAAVPVEPDLIVEGARPGASLPETGGSALGEATSESGRRYRIRRNEFSLPRRLYARIESALGRNPAPAPGKAAGALRRDSSQEEVPAARAKPSRLNVVIRRHIAHNVLHYPTLAKIWRGELPADAAVVLTASGSDVPGEPEDQKQTALHILAKRVWAAATPLRVIAGVVTVAFIANGIRLLSLADLVPGFNSLTIGVSILTLLIHLETVKFQAQEAKRWKEFLTVQEEARTAARARLKAIQDAVRTVVEDQKEVQRTRRQFQEYWEEFERLLHEKWGYRGKRADMPLQEAYQELGLSRDELQQTRKDRAERTLKRAYRRLAWERHPDIRPAAEYDQANHEMGRLAIAFSVVEEDLGLLESKGSPHGPKGPASHGPTASLKSGGPVRIGPSPRAETDEAEKPAEAGVQTPSETLFPPPVQMEEHPWNLQFFGPMDPDFPVDFSRLNRHPEQVAEFRARILPLLVARHRQDRTLRLTVLGAATGDEPATLLAAIVEEFESRRNDWGDLGAWNIRVDGIELHPDIAEEARRRTVGQSPFAVFHPFFIGFPWLQPTDPAYGTISTLNRHRPWVAGRIVIHNEDAVSDQALQRFLGSDAIFMNAASPILKDESARSKLLEALGRQGRETFFLGTESPFYPLFHRIKSHHVEEREPDTMSLAYSIAVPAWAQEQWGAKRSAGLTLPLWTWLIARVIMRRHHSSAQDLESAMKEAEKITGHRLFYLIAVPLLLEVFMLPGASLWFMTWMAAPVAALAGAAIIALLHGRPARGRSPPLTRQTWKQFLIRFAASYVINYLAIQSGSDHAALLLGLVPFRLTPIWAGIFLHAGYNAFAPAWARLSASRDPEKPGPPPAARVPGFLAVRYLITSHVFSETVDLDETFAETYGVALADMDRMWDEIEAETEENGFDGLLEVLKRSVRRNGERLRYLQEFPGEPPADYFIRFVLDPYFALLEAERDLDAGIHPHVFYAGDFDEFRQSLTDLGKEVSADFAAVFKIDAAENPLATFFTDYRDADVEKYRRSEQAVNDVLRRDGYFILAGDYNQIFAVQETVPIGVGGVQGVRFNRRVGLGYGSLSTYSISEQHGGASRIERSADSPFAGLSRPAGKAYVDIFVDALDDRFRSFQSTASGESLHPMDITRRSFLRRLGVPLEETDRFEEMENALDGMDFADISPTEQKKNFETAVAMRALKSLFDQAHGFPDKRDDDSLMDALDRDFSAAMTSIYLGPTPAHALMEWVWQTGNHIGFAVLAAFGDESQAESDEIVKTELKACWEVAQAVLRGDKSIDDLREWAKDHFLTHDWAPGADPASNLRAFEEVAGKYSAALRDDPPDAPDERIGWIIQAMKDLIALGPDIAKGVTAADLHSHIEKTGRKASMETTRRELRGLWLAGFFDGRRGENGREGAGAQSRRYHPAPWFSEALGWVPREVILRLADTKLPSLRASRLSASEADGGRLIDAWREMENFRQALISETALGRQAAQDTLDWIDAHAAEFRDRASRPLIYEFLLNLFRWRHFSGNSELRSAVDAGVPYAGRKNPEGMFLGPEGFRRVETRLREVWEENGLAAIHGPLDLWLAGLAAGSLAWDRRSLMDLKVRLPAVEMSGKRFAALKGLKGKALEAELDRLFRWRPLVEELKYTLAWVTGLPGAALIFLAAAGAPLPLQLFLAAGLGANLILVTSWISAYRRHGQYDLSSEAKGRRWMPEVRNYHERLMGHIALTRLRISGISFGIFLSLYAVLAGPAWPMAPPFGAAIAAVIAGTTAGFIMHREHDKSSRQNFKDYLDYLRGDLQETPSGPMPLAEMDMNTPPDKGGDPSPAAQAEEILAAIRRGSLATGRLKNSLKPLKDELEVVLGNLGLSAEFAGQLSQQLIKKTGVNSPQDPRLPHLAQRLQGEMTELGDLRIPRTPLFRGILKLTPAEIRSLKQRIERTHPAIAETILDISLLSAEPGAAASRFMARYDAALAVLLASEEQEVAKTIAHHSLARKDAEAGAVALLRTFQGLVEELSRRAPPALAREAALNSFWAKNPLSKALGYLQADAEKPGRHVRILTPGHLAEKAPLLEFPFAGPVQLRAGSREYTITAQDHGFTVTDEASGGARSFPYGGTAAAETYSDGDDLGEIVWNRIRFSAQRAGGTPRLRIISARDLTSPIRVSWTTPEPLPAVRTSKDAARPDQERRGRLIEAIRDLLALAPRIGGGGITALEFEGLAQTERSSLSLHMARRELRGLWLAGFFEGADGEQGRKRVGNPFRYYLPPWFVKAAERLPPAEMENLINAHLSPALQVSELPNDEEARSAAQAAVANFRRQARAALRAADEAERLFGLEYINLPEVELRDSLLEIGLAAEKIDALAAWLSEHGEIDSAAQAGEVLGISTGDYRSLIKTLENADAWRALEFDMDDIADRLDALERGEGVILEGVEAAIEELQAAISRLEEIGREQDRLVVELPPAFFTYDLEGMPAASSLLELAADRRRSLADRARTLLNQHLEDPEAFSDIAWRALTVTTSILHDYVRSACEEIGEIEIYRPASEADASLSWLGVHEGLVLQAQVIPGDSIKIRLDLSEKAAESHEAYTLSATFAVVMVDALSGQVHLPSRWNRRDNRQISFEYHNVPPGSYRFDVIETSPTREQLGEGGSPKALHWTALTALAGLAAWAAGFAPGAFWAAGAALEVLVAAVGLWNPARFELLHELEYQSFSDLRRAEIHDWRIVARNKHGRITQINPDILRGLPQWLQRYYVLREKFFLQKLGKPGDALTYPLDPLFLAWTVLRAAAWDLPKGLIRKAVDAQRKKLAPWHATQNDPSRALEAGETLHVGNIGPANVLISLAGETWRLRPSRQAGRLVLENLVNPPPLYLRSGKPFILSAQSGRFAIRRHFLTNVVSVTNLGPEQMTLRLEKPALPGSTGRRGTGSLIPWSSFYTKWLAPAAELVLAALIQAALPWDNVWLKALLTASVIYAAHLIVHGIYFRDWKAGFTLANAETSLGLGAAAGLFGGLGAGQAAPWLFAAAQAGRHFVLNRNFPFWRRHVVAGYALLEASGAAVGPRAEAFRALLENSGRLQTGLTGGLDPQPWRRALADKAAAQFHILANPEGGERARRRAQVNLAVLAYWLGMDDASALGLAETALESGAPVQGAQGLWTAYKQQISLSARELRRLGVRPRRASYNEGARAEKPHLAAVYLPALEEDAEVWNITAEHAWSMAAQPREIGSGRHRALVLRADPGHQEAGDAWKTAVKERWMERLLQAGRARGLNEAGLSELEIVVVPTSGLLTRDGILAGALPALGISPERKEAFGLSLFSATENGLDLSDLAAVLYRLLKGDRLVPILDVIDNQRVYATQA